MRIIYDEPVGYTVGKIDKWVTIPGKVTYIYNYEVDGVSYKGKEKTYGIGQKDETLARKQFIVVYEKGNPSNSDLNRRFSIESDADFQDFLASYATAPPAQDFPNKCN